jgi:hypothetical protein
MNRIHLPMGAESYIFAHVMDCSLLKYAIFPILTATKREERERIELWNCRTAQKWKWQWWFCMQLFHGVICDWQLVIKWYWICHSVWDDIDFRFKGMSRSPRNSRSHFFSLTQQKTHSRKVLFKKRRRKQALFAYKWLQFCHCSLLRKDSFTKFNLNDDNVGNKKKRMENKQFLTFSVFAFCNLQQRMTRQTIRRVLKHAF